MRTPCNGNRRICLDTFTQLPSLKVIEEKIQKFHHSPFQILSISITSGIFYPQQYDERVKKSKFDDDKLHELTVQIQVFFFKKKEKKDGFHF